MQAASPVSLGIVGCGRATSTLHLPALASLSGFHVAAVADLDGSRLDSLAERFRIPHRYADLPSLLQNGEIEAVAICTPAGAHAEGVLAALAAGKHVFVEKPLALTLADGARIAQAAAESVRVTAVGFNLRCHRLVRRGREIIASGGLGRIQQVISVWGSEMQHDPAMPEWRRRRATGGGALFEIGIHHLDACAFLLGELLAEVQLLTRSGRCEDESVSLVARSSGGVLVASSFSQVTAPVNEFRILGDQGSLSFSVYRGDSFQFVHRSHPQHGWRARLDGLKRFSEFPAAFRVARLGGDYLLSYREEWLRFAQAVRGEGAPAATVADGFHALKVLHAAVESSHSGKLTPVASP